MAEQLRTTEVNYIAGGLLDMTGVGLSRLDELPWPNVERALRKILEDDDTGPVAGFSSTI